jgi:uncharacterized protein (TIRG00374 family)
MTRRGIWRVIAFVLTLVVGGGLFAFIVSKQGVDDILVSLSSFGLLPFIGFVIISLANFLFYSLRWQLIINKHVNKKQRVPLRKVYMHRMAGFAMSYLTPAAQVGGEPVRIAMLSSEEEVSLKQSTSSVILDIAFELSAYIVFILAGVGLAVFEGLGDGNSFLIITIGLGAALLILLIFFAAIARGKGFFVHVFRIFRLNKMKPMKKFEKSLVDTEKMMKQFLLKNPRLVFTVSLLSLLVISFRVVEVFYISYFFGVDLNFAQAFLMSTLPGVALVLPIPAGLGVFEGSFATLFTLLAIPLNAVAFALVIRSRDLVFIFLGLIHMLLRGKAFIEKKILKPVIEGGRRL